MRMSAEQIRDNALAVSGLLVKTLPAGPVYIRISQSGVWVLGVTPYRYPRPEETLLDEQHRRSLYSL